MTQAKAGDTVRVNYKGTLADGTVFDTSEGREPLTVELGSSGIIRGFSEAIQGMSPGESKEVTVPMDKAYGPHNAEMVITAPRVHIPPDLHPEVGQKLQMGGPKGELVMVQVVEVTDEQVILDANPPLAGKDLTFFIELVEIIG